MLNGERKIARPLRWAMVGGGRLSQVGYKHRCGALRDNTAYQLVAGAFDLDAERGRDFGAAIGVDPRALLPRLPDPVPRGGAARGRRRGRLDRHARTRPTSRSPRPRSRPACT